MSPHGFMSRSLAPLAAMLLVATTTSMAHARMVDININAHISQSMTTTLDQRGHGGWPSWGTSPPPAVYNGPRRWQTSDDTGGGGTGGFSPGGGSGTTPKKKPNQQ